MENQNLSALKFLTYGAFHRRRAHHLLVCSFLSLFFFFLVVSLAAVNGGGPFFSLAFSSSVLDVFLVPPPSHSSTSPSISSFDDFFFYWQRNSPHEFTRLSFRRDHPLLKIPSSRNPRMERGRYRPSSSDRGQRKACVLNYFRGQRISFPHFEEKERRKIKK